MRAPPGRSPRARPRSVVVAGLGLIGGSLAAGLVRAGRHVVGVDRAPVIRDARRRGWVHTGHTQLLPALDAAELLVLAAPPRANLELLEELAAELRAGRAGPRAVTDVGSVKCGIVQRAAALGLRRFVGGHPLAGNAGRGLRAADPDLFRGRAWAVCPLPRAAPGAPALVRRLVRAVGARPMTLTAARHDRAVAFLSHLPQVVAWALAAVAARDPVAGQLLGLAGPGFRDMTRLAASPKELWAEILDANSVELRRAQRALVGALARGVGVRRSADAAWH